MIMGHCVYSGGVPRDGVVTAVVENSMGRTLAFLLLLPPLAVPPVTLVVAFIGNWSASVKLILDEAIFMAIICMPLALLVQCTYGLACFWVLGKLGALSLWSCLLAGCLPFVALRMVGYIEETRVTIMLGIFGVAVALVSWAVLRARNALS